MRVLIIEDDPSVGRLLRRAAEEAGYTVDAESDGVAGLDAATRRTPDLILLDVMLPGLDGIALLRRLRGARNHVPILIITARDSVEAKIEGLDSGADDYIVKPFLVGELLARMRALIRRGTSAPALLQVGELTLDPLRRVATRAGKSTMLSATEFALLEYLMRNSGRVLTRSLILEHVWQYDFEGRDNVLDVYISYLRSKLDKGHKTQLIHTARGVGYWIGDRSVR